MASPKRAEDLRLVHTSTGDGETALPTHGPQSCGVEIENATLKYPVGPFVRGSLKSSIMKLLGHRERKIVPSYVEAMSKMNLSIAFGERVGVIGRNGSGKSTFLRALAGIYPLETGRISVVGQIGTLLDIGLGFESESTGRENIYYRGMAMGYSPKAMKEVEQRIIDFADLGDFIDLPMRTYSSGMYVRLGFAISTQISPDVLLVDEVFGAGDASFQERALVRMLEVVKHAGIVVLASHDTALIERLCTRVIWLERGQVAQDGAANSVVSQYLKTVRGEG